jgi:hypothetical protein
MRLEIAAGQWHNPGSESYVRATIRKDGDKWKIRLWASREPEPFDWGEVELRPLRERLRRNLYGFAHWYFNSINTYVVVQLIGDAPDNCILRIESVDLFDSPTPDGGDMFSIDELVPTASVGA